MSSSTIDIPIDEMKVTHQIIPYTETREIPGRVEVRLVRLWAKLHILLLALKTYRSISKAKGVLSKFSTFKKQLAGRDGRRKIVRKNNKYWFGLYVPGFPSANFNRFILTEFNRYEVHTKPKNEFQQLNFAITTHCPMRCEHCFEWDNLNKPETFSIDELKNITQSIQQGGLGHISLSGGEPMVRFREMVELIREGDKSTDWWILTSGFNLSPAKAKELKEAGATGVIVSIDHYIPELHNMFRGHLTAFEHATNAVLASKDAGLVTAISICLTRETANRDFLLKHADLCTSLGADFIQWLEPRAEGHYRHQDVLLRLDHIVLIEQLFEEMNHDTEFSSFPPIIYHGYHQRRIGCMSGGKFSFYIDAVGLAHSCPFCHSEDFNIKDWLLQSTPSRKNVTPCSAFPEP